jgi:hypothetical protein
MAQHPSPSPPQAGWRGENILYGYQFFFAFGVDENEMLTSSAVGFMQYVVKAREDVYTN